MRDIEHPISLSRTIVLLTLLSEKRGIVRYPFYEGKLLGVKGVKILGTKPSLSKITSNFDIMKYR